MCIDFRVDDPELNGDLESVPQVRLAKYFDNNPFKKDILLLNNNKKNVT